MEIDHRQALIRLIAAFEEHFEAALDSDGGEYTPRLEAAEQRLRDAFFTYDDALFTELGVELPFDILDEDDDEDLDDKDDDGLDDLLGEDDLEDFNLND